MCCDILVNFFKVFNFFYPINCDQLFYLKPTHRPSGVYQKSFTQIASLEVSQNLNPVPEPKTYYRSRQSFFSPTSPPMTVVPRRKTFYSSTLDCIKFSVNSNQPLLSQTRLTNFFYFGAPRLAQRRRTS